MADFDDLSILERVSNRKKKIQDDSEKFLTSSGVVEYWDTARSDPIRKWSWGHDTYNRVKFNPIETDLACATVRSG